MALATLKTQLRRLTETLAGPLGRSGPTLRTIRRDPAAIFTLAGMTPDAWQAGLMRCSSDRILMLAARQTGKSTTAAALSLREALLRPDALVLVLSPSLRQSAELYRKVADLHGRLGRPLGTQAESALRLELGNGSRVVSLPSSEATVRGFSGVSLLLVDEASRVPDPLYFACRPMLSTSRGRLVLLSTPWGQDGFFYREWSQGVGWRRERITASMCSRIDPEFLAEERRAMAPRLYAREYECEFSSPSDALYDPESIRAAMTPGGDPPLFS